MGGGTSIARIASGAYRNRQSLQDWSRVGAVTPGSHLRWLPGARVEFPYREPHDGGRIRDRGDDARWALWRVGVAADEFRRRWGRRRWMRHAWRWRRPQDSGGAMGGGTSIARIASGADRNRQSLQDWSRVGAVTPGIHLRWLPGARVEFPYRERTMEVEFESGGTTPDGRCGESRVGANEFPRRWGPRRMGVVTGRLHDGGANWRRGGSLPSSMDAVADRVASSIGAAADCAAGGQLFSGLGGAGISLPPMVARPSRSTTPMA